MSFLPSRRRMLAAVALLDPLGHIVAIGRSDSILVAASPKPVRGMLVDPSIHSLS